MITTATFIAVLVDIAMGARAYRRIAQHEVADNRVHAELRGRVAALEPVGLYPVGFRAGAVGDEDTN